VEYYTRRSTNGEKGRPIGWAGFGDDLVEPGAKYTRQPIRLRFSPIILFNSNPLTAQPNCKV
jgi:hypothetical protein